MKRVCLIDMQGAYLSFPLPFSDGPVPPHSLVGGSCSQGGIHRQPLHLVTCRRAEPSNILLVSIF